MHGAGAAQTSAATEFRPGHLQMFADDPQQGRVVRHIDRMIMPIDVQGGHTPSSKGGSLFPSRSAARQLRDIAGIRRPAYAHTAMCGGLEPASYCSANNKRSTA
jgi:hypothetical protein